MGCAQSTAVVQAKGKELLETAKKKAEEAKLAAERKLDAANSAALPAHLRPAAAPVDEDSGSLQHLRSAVGRLHALQRVTLAPRKFLPSVLPGHEDEDDQRQHMAERQAFAEESAREW